MNSTKQIAVIGGGSWATAVVKMLCNNCDQVHWWLRNTASIEHIKKYKHNPNYLTSVEFDTNKLVLNTNIKEVIATADIIVMAVPSAFLKDALFIPNQFQLWLIHYSVCLISFSNEKVHVP